MTTYRRILPALFLGLICGAASLRADMINQVQNVPLQPLDWTGGVPLSFDLFNPATGTLNSITFSVSVALEGSVGVENLDGFAPNTIIHTFTALFELTRPDTSLILDTQPLVSDSNVYGIYDLVTDYAGTSGLFFQNLSALSSSNITSSSFADLALFTGVGSIILNMNGTDLSGVVGDIGKATPASDITSLGQAQVTLAYNYSPIPEPQTISFLILGIALIRRRLMIHPLPHA